VTTSSLLQNIFEVSAQVLDPNNPLATTGFGRIRGSVQDIGDGKTILSFIGIPFAAPPTRGNRFRVSPTLFRL
jgi:carboxylesterase type B